MRKKQSTFKKSISVILAAVMVIGSAGSLQAKADESFQGAESPNEAVLSQENDSQKNNSQELQLKFDETVEDSSGKKVPVTVKGMEQYVDGVDGKALSLDGRTYLNLGTSGELQPGNLTTAFWVNIPSQLTGEHMIMWNKPNGIYNGQGWYLSCLSDTEPLKLSVGMSPTEISVVKSRSEFFPIGEWVHIAVTYNSATGEGQIYRNGEAQELKYIRKGDKIVGNDRDSKYLGFNSPIYNEGFAKLILDDFEIYSKDFTPKEVLSLYHRYDEAMSDEDMVDQDIESLDPFRAVDLSRVTGDLTLPALGKNGSDIVWVSSREEVVSNEGRVVRPGSGAQNAQVSLTAFVTSGEVTKSKQYDMTVLAETANQLFAGYDMTFEDGMLKDKTGRYPAKVEGLSESNVTAGEDGERRLNFTGNKSQYVKLPAGMIEQGDESITIDMKLNTSQKDFAWVFNLGTKNVNDYVFLNPIRKGGEAAFTLKQNGNAEQSVNVGGAITPGEDTIVTMVFNEDATADLYINGKLAGSTVHGYKLTQILKNGVTDPSDAIGYLGLSLYSGDPGYIGSISYFDVYNYSMNDQEVWQRYADKNLDLTDEDRVAADLASLNLKEGELSADFLKLPVSGLNGCAIKWESSNQSVIALDGRVTRPAAGEPDEEVTLKATVSMGNHSASRTFQFHVLAYSDMQGLEEFTLNSVDVTDPYYDNASAKDIAYLKEFDAERLLSRFRETAGLNTLGIKPYIGWEDSYIGGHTLGHYLTACAQAYQSADNPEDREWMKNRLSYLIDQLKLCQDAVGTGFLFGAQIQDKNKIEKQFDIMEGKDNGNNWVPWYTMHKILSGLVDVYKFTEDEDALTVASSLGDWIYNRVSKWDTATQRRVLNIEYGGMNDCLYELYKFTDKEEHAKAAHMFDEVDLFAQVLAGTPNALNGKHANTTIPKFIGALNRYRAMDQKVIDGETVDASVYLEYVEAFWTMVIDKHTYITGGNSEWEHFGADNILDAERTQCNCETCNTYNMLKMTRELFKITGNKKYADFYENTFLNAIMSSINPDTGMTTYFQPMATGYFKVYGDTDITKNQFWCCTGSGLENFTKLGDSIYFYKDNRLFVNQYVSSCVTWKNKNIKFTQTASMPESDSVEMVVNLLDSAKSADMDLRLRVPDWIAGAPSVQVNGESVESVVSSGYVRLNRTWMDGDRVTIQIPMNVTAHTLFDNNNAYGFKYGPVVLSAELGTDNQMDLTTCGVAVSIPRTKTVGSESASPKDGSRAVLGTETINLDSVTKDTFLGNINDYLVQTTGENGKLAFELKGTDHELTFTTHYQQHEQRYGIYWYLNGAGGDAEDQQKIILEQKEIGRANQAKIDVIKAGYGQYENDDIHKLEDNHGVGSTGGSDEAVNGMTTRYANADGYFSYRMIVNKEKTNYILAKLARIDNGKTLTITAGDTVIYNQTLNYSGKDNLYENKIEIPKDVVDKAQTITVEDTATGTQKSFDVVTLKFTGAPGEASARLVEEMYISTSYNKNASLISLTADKGTVAIEKDGYRITVPKETKEVGLTTKLADTYGLLYVNGILVNDSAAQKFSLEQDTTTIAFKVYAEDHETSKDYSITIKRAAEPEKILVQEITLSPTAQTLDIGESFTIAANIKPNNASNLSLRYTSDKPLTAEVTGNKVTAKSPGTAIITALSQDGSGVMAVMTVTVKAPLPEKVSVKGITLSPSSKKLTVGESISLTTVVSPSNATNKAVLYTSSNPLAVTVNENKVTAKSAGTAIITAAAQDGSGIKATMSITVKLAPPKNVKVQQTGTKSVKLSWSKAAGAKKYDIYRSNKASTGYRKVKTVTGASYTDKKTGAGKTYYYKVRAIGSTSAYNSSDSSTAKISLLKKPSISLKAGKTGQVKVGWKKISGASGYEVYVSDKKSKGYKRKAMIKKQSTVSTTVKKLSRDKKSYVKIRAYKMTNGRKVYSEYSKVKSVIVK